MRRITKATINSIIKNGGATINKRGERVVLKTGYQVSKCDLAIIDLENFNKFALMSLMCRLEKRGEYLGVWVDNGKVYIDISHRIATRKQAMQAGRELNQLTILRWRDGECLVVEG